MSIPSQPPPSLKPVSHYLKVAIEHVTRDRVISYWVVFAAVQKSLTIDKSSPEAKIFVVKLLEWLETQKKELAGNEAITVEAAGEAHIENYAIKLFSWADQSDRSGVFNKNVVKAFYTAGILFDILETLKPPLSEEFSTSRKYSKWKAAYIHNCLKNGETPIPGDEVEDGEDTGAASSADPPASSSGFYGFVSPQQPDQTPYTPPQPYQTPYMPPQPDHQNIPNEFTNYGPAQPPVYPSAQGYHGVPQETLNPVYDTQPATSSLSVEQIGKAQKYCKWAGSALNFDDVNSAIENLEKALRLLKTGQES